MKLIWTKSNLPLSVLIRGVTGEDCSHFAFVFESTASGLLFQSNLLGTNSKFFNTEKNTWGFKIVHELDIPMTVEEEDRAWELMVNSYDDVPYNFLGAAYLGWRKLLHRVFGLKVPAKNAWSQHATMFCDQIYTILNKLQDPRLKHVNVGNGMATPYDLWVKVGVQITSLVQETPHKTDTQEKGHT